MTAGEWALLRSCVLVNVCAFLSDDWALEHVRVQLKASTSIACLNAFSNDSVGNGFFGCQARHNRESNGLATDCAVAGSTDGRELWSNGDNDFHVVVIGEALVSHADRV